MKIKDAFALGFTIAALIISFSVASWAQNKQYQRATDELCRNYKDVPVQYIDRVPDGCITKYFEKGDK